MKWCCVEKSYIKENKKLLFHARPGSRSEEQRCAGVPSMINMAKMRALTIIPTPASRAIISITDCFRVWCAPARMSGMTETVAM